MKSVVTRRRRGRGLIVRNEISGHPEKARAIYTPSARPIAVSTTRSMRDDVGRCTCCCWCLHVARGCCCRYARCAGGCACPTGVSWRRRLLSWRWRGAVVVAALVVLNAVAVILIVVVVVVVAAPRLRWRRCSGDTCKKRRRSAARAASATHAAVVTHRADAPPPASHHSKAQAQHAPFGSQ